MDKLPHALLLRILSQLDDSADVARCRVAYKPFNTVFPDVRWIKLRCTREWFVSAAASGSGSEDINNNIIKPGLKEVFMDLVWKLKHVEYVCVRHDMLPCPETERQKDCWYLMDDDFAKEWLPIVSESLNTLNILGLSHHDRHQSNFLPLLSKYCHNLCELTFKFARLSVEKLNLMPMLTSLTLAFTTLEEDPHLNQFNKCFPNLQRLDLISVKGLQHPKIHLLNLRTLEWAIYNHHAPSLTIIAPNLITLKILTFLPAAIHVEAPNLSHFHLTIPHLKHAARAFTAQKFENLKTLSMSCCWSIGVLLSEFPITKTVETLTLESGNQEPSDGRDSKLTIRKVFLVFPNVTSLCIKQSTWSEIEACLNPEGWEILDGRKGLKSIRLYLKLVDPLLTFSSVSRVLDQCLGLAEVSLLIHNDVVNTESKSFMSKCMARWPGLKWRWGIWSHNMDDSWITDDMSN